MTVKKYLRYIFLVAFVLLAALFWLLNGQGVGLGTMSGGEAVTDGGGEAIDTTGGVTDDGAGVDEQPVEPKDAKVAKAGGRRTIAYYLSMVFIILAAYEIMALLVTASVHLRKGAKSEVTMLSNFLRVVAGVAILIALMSSLGVLGRIGAVVGAFAGMLLGWSLQAPVSGMAAWALICVKRPFRLGDRVMLPNWGLTGDVEQIGLMYTVLNQVGGTVGSEERAGRYVLIPNAILFSTVVINFTPQQNAAYILDEVVTRVTFDSDWDTAENIMLEAAVEVTGDIIAATGTEPYIRSDMSDYYGVIMRLRYITAATDRPRIAHEIVKRIFRGFQLKEGVDFAMPYIYSAKKGEAVARRQMEAAPIPVASAPVKEQETEELDIETVELAPGDDVFTAVDEAQIGELSAKIEQRGLLQPLIVERKGYGRYVVIAGRLRFESCRRLGWQKIPAFIHDSGRPPEMGPGEAEA